MNNNYFRRAFHYVFFILIAALFSQANAESIGRTNLFLDGGNWSMLTSYEGNLIFDQGRFTSRLHTEVFQQLGADGEPIAVLVVTSTDLATPTTVRWLSEICPDPRERYFTEDFGSNRQHRVRNCLIVNSAFATFKFYKPDAEVLQAMDAKGLHIFKSGYSLRSVFGATNGVLLRVNLMTTKKFKGLTDAPVEAEQLYGVPPELIAWAEELHRRVKKSAQSMGGELEIPSVEFNE